MLGGPGAVSGGHTCAGAGGTRIEGCHFLFYVFNVEAFALYRYEGQLDASLEFRGEVRAGQTAGTAQQRGLNSQVSAEGHLRCERGQTIWSVMKREAAKGAEEEG